MPTKTLLIVINRPSPNTQKLADAVVNGANHEDIVGVNVIFREPLDATADDVLNCDGILLGTTENFGYMSGVLKDFFERIYYPCIEHTEGLPYGLYVRAGLDGTGAQSAVERIVTGLKWSAIQPCVTLKGDYDLTFEQQCFDMGMLMAAGLETGVF
ncbi:flavodoxin family protein [Granulosicoccus sp.]|nr:flavodoxin family protein [Granulosicoccus sp.]MDB4224611.1 flavodoxin family protein [Granulosicoccus sp.]